MPSVAQLEGAAERDFDFGPREFERVRKLIHAQVGIALSPSRSAMVYNRLSRSLRQLGLTSFDAYLSGVERGEAAECEAFTNALTTNLTSFFREAHHFPMLREHLLRAGARQPLTIWCAAASTGEEPYSLAMTAIESFDSAQPPVQIIASDVDTGVLATAEAGVYTSDRLDKMDADRRRRHFLRGSGNHEGKVRVRPEVARLVAFRQINLLDRTWNIPGSLDAIFCRNVMIYFDKPTQLALLERFAPMLKPDGLLFTGHSENLHHASHLFRLRGKTVYGRAT